MRSLPAQLAERRLLDLELLFARSFATIESEVATFRKSESPLEGRDFHPNSCFFIGPVDGSRRR
jgi:hypothetical protein